MAPEVPGVVAMTMGQPVSVSTILVPDRDQARQS
jgi:hypothetical protein